MSNDLLPSPDLLAEPVQDGGAAAMLANDAGDERKRGVFTEYKAADAAPDANDTRTLLQTIARLEAAMRDAPSRVTAGLVRGLADFAAAIKQIESMLAANEAPAPDVHFALEHIQDIAMALRLREVEAALCDTLDAAIREVGDAIVRGDAAAARTQSAAVLLRELARQISQMIALGDDIAGAAPAEKIVSPAAATAERFDNTSNEPLADSVDVPALDAQHGSLPRPLPSVAALPDKQAPSGLTEDQVNLFAPVASSILRALDFVDEETAAACDQPSELIIAENSASNLAVSAATTNITEVALISAPLDIGADTPRTARAAANDPLAALNALSEEEIIALFS